MDVTFVVITKNRPEMTKHLVNSILEAKLDSFSLVLIDDSNHDNFLQTGDSLQSFPIPFVETGIVNSTVVVGTSDPHGPCGSAHTMDTVGGMGITAALARNGSVAEARFWLDTDIAWYDFGTYQVYYSWDLPRARDARFFFSPRARHYFS